MYSSPDRIETPVFLAVLMFCRLTFATFFQRLSSGDSRSMMKVQ
jgi:hypothetical protein